MDISTDGLSLIKSFEGLCLTAYRCQAGVLTIGYGHTANVKIGDSISQQTADSYLMCDLHRTQMFINKFVRAELNQNQYDALCSLVFNIGVGNFERSTLLKKLNNNDFVGAANEFSCWNKIRKNGELVVSNGLIKRRYEEQQLFSSQA